jgi:hypothetical protein
VRHGCCHDGTMPIFYSNVNGENREKLVPITRQIGTSFIPDYYVNALARVEESPENGPFWEAIK